MARREAKTTKRKAATKASAKKKATSKKKPTAKTKPERRRPVRDRRTGRLRFPSIAPRAYEHPADRAALTALRAVPGFDAMLRAIFGAIGDRSLRLAFLASAVRVTERQFPTVHALHREACRTLDVDPVPELFVAQTPFVNAGTIGVGKPFIVLNSGILGLLDDDELRYLLGHELGHVLSGHSVYKTMLRVILRLTLLARAIPLGSVALYGIATSLLEWDRKSELTADRAGYLVAQDRNVAIHCMMKLAGGGRTDQMSIDEFRAQAEEYVEGGGVVDSVMKLVSLMGRTHPFPVLRLAALEKWLDDGGFDELRSGYPVRDGTEGSVARDVVASAGRYKKDFEETRDPLFKLVRDLAQQLGQAGTSIADALRRPSA